MIKEIDVLLKANARGCMIVDKESHVLMNRDELIAAQQIGLYEEESVLSPPDCQVEMSGRFPGCMQIGGSTECPEVALLSPDR